MAANSNEVIYEIKGALRVHKNGAVERFLDTDFVPPSFNLPPSLSSKDITIIPSDPEPRIPARIFLPIPDHPAHKFPLLIYFHGGGFCLSSPFCKKYHLYVSKLAAEANAVAISVDYRKAPENPIPAAYEDSWAALKWVAAHRDGGGQEPWLNHHADFGRVFLAGDSAGGNIAHNLAMAAGNPDPDSGLGIEILGMALIQPFFWGSESVGSEMVDPGRRAVVDELWPLICRTNPDNDDPRVNPVDLVGLGCKRVLVGVAERDILKDRGWKYYNLLSRSGWMGVVEIMESEGEEHGFHLYDLEGGKATTRDLIDSLCFFFNRDVPFY